MPILLVFGLILIAVVSWGVSTYNSLIRLRSQLERSWSNIDVVLKQRFDEIPQLIQVIEQYASYESGLLKSLADARSKYHSASNPNEKIQATQDMSVALRGVIAIGENYPELKANENFQQLQQRVSGLEGAISDRRETYNDAVANFNTRIEQFPSVLIANYLNYRRQEMFKVESAEREKPSLKMNLPNFNR